MPPSASSSTGASRPASNNALSRKATAARPGGSSKPAQQVIEIDDSSDDEPAPPRAFAGRPLAMPSRLRPAASNAAAGTSNSGRGGSTLTRASDPTTSRTGSRSWSAAAATDDSATEDTSDDDRRPPKRNRNAILPARPNLDDLSSTAEGSSSSVPRARNAHPSSKANTSSNKGKRKAREASTSATEDSSEDEAIVVASSARRVSRPVSTATNNSRRMERRTTRGSSIAESVAEVARPRVIQRNPNHSDRRIMPDPSIDLPTTDSDSASETTVASTARATAARNKTRTANKRTLEPEFAVVVTTKRGRVAASEVTAGPSTISTRTRTRRGSSVSVATSTSVAGSTTAAPSRVSAKGKGRALRSSIEPVSSKKPSRRTHEQTSARASRDEVYTSFFKELEQSTAISPGSALFGNKRTETSTSTIVTKIVIKPTDLSEELECAICSEIMVSAVSLVCGHTFCDACVTPWLDTNKDCPSCRTKMETVPARCYVADRVIKKYLEAVYASLEAEGKHKEAKVAREERALAEKEAEVRRMRAAADKNRREAAAANAAAAVAARIGGGAAVRNGLMEFIRGGPQAVPQAQVPAPAPPARVNGAGGRRGARARLEAAQQQMAAQAAALAQAQAQGPAAAGAGAAAAAAAGANNAAQFGNLLQHRGGAFHVDPNALQQTANDMGIPVAQLFQMIFQG